MLVGMSMSDQLTASYTFLVNSVLTKAVLL